MASSNSGSKLGLRISNTWLYIAQCQTFIVHFLRGTTKLLCWNDRDGCRAARDWLKTRVRSGRAPCLCPVANAETSGATLHPNIAGPVKYKSCSGLPMLIYTNELPCLSLPYLQLTHLFLAVSHHSSPTSILIALHPQHHYHVQPKGSHSRCIHRWSNSSLLVR